MADQDPDPIAEALAAVDRQFAERASRALPDDNAAPAALSAVGYDDETEGDAPADEPGDSDTDEPIDADAEESEEEETALPAVIPWEDPASPYHAHFLAAQEKEQQAMEAEGRLANAQRFLDLLRQARANEDAKALHAQLQEVDPQLAEQYLGQRTGLMQQAQAAQQATVGYQHGLAALHLAMTDVLGDEAATQQIVARARELAAQPGLQHMQQMVNARRQAAQSDDARVAELENTVRELQLRLGARGRSKAADVVDSAPAAQPRLKDAWDAPSVDGVFEAGWNPFG